MSYQCTINHARISEHGTPAKALTSISTCSNNSVSMINHALDLFVVFSECAYELITYSKMTRTVGDSLVTSHKTDFSYQLWIHISGHAMTSLCRRCL